MSDNLYERLKRRSARTSNGRFGQQSTTAGRAAANHFSARPGVSQSSQSPGSTRTGRGTTLAHGSHQRQTQQPQKKRETGPWDETDRPPAYYPPAGWDPNNPEEWTPPSLREDLKELGWRLLEVALGAGGEAALGAVGRELGYFFSQRRWGLRDKFRRYGRG